MAKSGLKAHILDETLDGNLVAAFWTSCNFSIPFKGINCTYRMQTILGRKPDHKSEAVSDLSGRDNLAKLNTIDRRHLLIHISIQEKWRIEKHPKLQSWLQSCNGSVMAHSSSKIQYKYHKLKFPKFVRIQL